MSIIKTIIPQICDINLSSTTELLKKYSDYLDILSDFTDEVKVSLEYRDTFFKNDTINSRINFFNTLDIKLKDFDTDFIAYWYEIFNSSPDYIKSKVTTKNLRFESDSVGKYANSSYVLDDSVLSVLDWSMNDSPPPNYIPYNALNKVSPWQKQMLQRASFRVNNMYRSNIALVQPVQKKSTENHGTNLVPDTQYYTRIRTRIKTNILNRIKQKFKDEIKILTYFCNLDDNQAVNYTDTSTNLQLMLPIEFELNVEQFNCKVDVLSNKIKYLKSRILNDDILSTVKVEVIAPKSKTTSEIDRLYRENIFNRLEKLDPKTFFKKISIDESKDDISGTQITNDLNAGRVDTSLDDTQVIREISAPANINEIPSTFNSFPANATYPTYSVPEWAKPFAECSGVGSTLNAFNGITDPLTILSNLTSVDFDLFASLKQVSPFDIDFNTFGIELDQTMSQLIATILRIDYKKLYSVFKNFPVNPFSLANLDVKGIGREVLDAVVEAVEQELRSQLVTFLNGLPCGSTLAQIGRQYV